MVSMRVARVRRGSRADSKLNMGQCQLIPIDELMKAQGAYGGCIDSIVRYRNDMRAPPPMALGWPDRAVGAPINFIWVTHIV